jgi:hypothetical protein
VLALLHEAALLLAGGQRIEWVTLDGRLIGFQLRLDEDTEGKVTRSRS